MKKWINIHSLKPEEFAKTGMAKGSGKPGGAMKKYLEANEKKKKMSEEKKPKDKKDVS